MNNLNLISNEPLTRSTEFRIKPSWGIESQNKNVEMLEGICDYFINRMNHETIESKSPVWDINVQLHGEIIEYIKIRDYDNMFDYMKKLFAKDITHGTAGGAEQYHNLSSNKSVYDSYLVLIFDKMLCLYQQLGFLPPFNPENYAFTRKQDAYSKIDPNEIFRNIHAQFGNLDVSAPKYSGGALGIETQFGIYTERDIMSLSIALEVSRKYADKNIKICEIGGGVGHLAYYLHKLGFTNISIVDLPTVSVSQMYFLGDNLGKNDIKLLSPDEFTGKYDLVLNVDSLPEMGEPTAKGYIDLITQNSNHFISINHEDNERGFSVNSLCNMKKVCRFPFWLRRGYLWEEFVA